MKATQILTALVLTSLPALAGPPPVAPAPPPPPAASGWEFRFAPYLWVQAVEGTVGVRGLEGDVDMGFDDILGDLDFAFMGAFEARNGRWSILTDVNYAELGQDFDPRGVLFSDADFKMQQFVGNITLNYRILENERTAVDLYAGTRLNWIDLDIDVDGVKGGDFGQSGDDFWADAIVGVRFQTSLGGPWFLRAGGDIGAGESDFTWQAVGLLGYKVSETCNVGLGYRGLGTDYQNGGFTYDVTAHGPVLGVEWRW